MSGQSYGLRDLEPQQAMNALTHADAERSPADDRSPALLEDQRPPKLAQDKRANQPPAGLEQLRVALGASINRDRSALQWRNKPAAVGRARCTEAARWHGRPCLAPLGLLLILLGVLPRATLGPGLRWSAVLITANWGLGRSRHAGQVLRTAITRLAPGVLVAGRWPFGKDRKSVV